MSTPEFPKYLSVKQVASILSVSDKFVYLHQREVPGYLTVAGKVLFDADVLLKELKKRSTGRAYPI